MKRNLLLHNKQVRDYYGDQLLWLETYVDNDLSQARDQVDELTLSQYVNPHTKGEQTVSGKMPHPESDDDTLLNTHAVGVGLKEDRQHLSELNIAQDVRHAEMNLRTT